MIAHELFRPEATEYAAKAAHDGEGDIIRISPSWTARAYHVLVAAALLALVLLVFCDVHEYAAGPAVVWVKDRVELTALSAATVAEVAVTPGARVSRDTILVRFESTQQLAELRRVERELDARMAKLLSDPSDDGARQAIGDLAAQRDLAQATVDAHTLKAPRDGIVGDVRVREGMRLAAGDLAATIWGDDAPRTLVAMLPGHFQPQLRPGMTLRFQVGGYRASQRELVIDSVGAQIIGPAEVRRYLGQEIADTMSVEGARVLVEAKVPGGSFPFGPSSLRLSHGMAGTAEVRLRARSLLASLLPDGLGRGDLP